MEGKVVRTLLAQNTDITILVANRINVVVTPQNSIYPYISYHKTGSSRTTAQKFKRVSEEGIYQINIFAQDYLQIISIAEAVKNSLDYIHNTIVAGLKVSTITPVTEIDGDYDQKSNVYHRFLIYEISINKT